jgi:glycosyltransferase involved in cell wall biosynthesis
MCIRDRPFIASDVPGLSELVSGAGLLFPAGDAAVLAETIKSLIEDKEYASCIADKCVARSEKYDINVMVDKYIELYNKIYGKK